MGLAALLRRKSTGQPGNRGLFAVRRRTPGVIRLDPATRREANLQQIQDSALLRASRCAPGLPSQSVVTASEVRSGDLVHDSEGFAIGTAGDIDTFDNGEIGIEILGSFEPEFLSPDSTVIVSRPS